MFAAVDVLNNKPAFVRTATGGWTFSVSKSLCQSVVEEFPAPWELLRFVIRSYTRKYEDVREACNPLPTSLGLQHVDELATLQLYPLEESLKCPKDTDLAARKNFNDWMRLGFKQGYQQAADASNSDGDGENGVGDVAIQELEKAYAVLNINGVLDAPLF